MSLTIHPSRDPRFCLVVDGLQTEYGLEKTLSTLVSELSQDKVALVSQKLTSRAGETVLLVELAFGIPGDFDERVAEAFCERMLELASDESLLRVSKFGVLGFRPVDGHPLEEWWNLVLLKILWVYGETVMGVLQARAIPLLSLGVLPEWFKIVTFVMHSPLETSLWANPLIDDIEFAKISSIRQTRLEKEQKLKRPLAWWSRKDSITVQILERLATEATQALDHDERIRRTREAFDMFHQSTGRVCEILVKCRENTNVNKESRRRIFKEMLCLIRHAYSAHVASLDLMRLYITWMQLHSVAAVGYGVVGYKTVARAIDMARSYMLPNSQISRELATSATQQVFQLQSRNLLVQTAGTTAAGAWAFGMFGYNTWQVYRYKDRKDYCEQVLRLILQTMKVSAETTMLLRWIDNSNGEVHFVDQGSLEWAQFLEDQAKGGFDEEFKSAEYVPFYLKVRHNELNEVQKRLSESVAGVFAI